MVEASGHHERPSTWSQCPCVNSSVSLRGLASATLAAISSSSEGSTPGSTTTEWREDSSSTLFMR